MMQGFRFRGKRVGVPACKVVERGSRTSKSDRQSTWLSCRRDVLRRCACRAVIECEPYLRPVGLRKMQRFVLTCLCGGSRAGPRLGGPSWQKHIMFSERTGSPCERRSGASPHQMLTPIRRLRRLVSSAGWHDWRYKPHPNVSDEQIWNPVYEAIRDYWIDSRLGPGYSLH